MRRSGSADWILVAVPLLFWWHGTAEQTMTQKHRRTERFVQLPPAHKKGAFSVEEAVATRRSVRSFTGVPLSMQEISQLLFAAQGITDTVNGFRAAPSAGATFPLEIFCVTCEGVFRYRPRVHALEKVKEGDLRGALSAAAYGQQCVRDAPLTVVLAAVFSRTTDRYGGRGIMYVHMEAGHAAQNIHLEAVALNLGSVPVGAFEEEGLHRLLGCGDDEKVIYCIPVGKAAR
jgi:SagB-type dehydrogenase family enzyme